MLSGMPETMRTDLTKTKSVFHTFSPFSLLFWLIILLLSKIGVN